MTRQMKAEREKRATILESEAPRQSEIQSRRGPEAGARSSRPKAASEAAFRDAEARERRPRPKPRQPRLVSDAIEGGSASRLNYFIAQKYVEASRQVRHLAQCARPSCSRSRRRG